MIRMLTYIKYGTYNNYKHIFDIFNRFLMDYMNEISILLAYCLNI